MSDIATDGVKLHEILSSIITALFDTPVSDDMPLVSQISDPDWSQKLSRVLNGELGVSISSEKVASLGSLSQLSKAIGS